MKNTNLFRVYKVRYAKELIKLGYKMVDFEENPRNIQRTVFIFESVSGLREDYYRIKEETWQMN